MRISSAQLPPPTARPEPPAVQSDGVSRLRVLMVVESSGGGTGRHVLDLAEGLLARGHEIHLIYSTGRVDKLFSTRLAEIKNLRSHPLTMRTTVHPSDFIITRQIKRYMREHGPFDVIHGHSSKGGALARLAALGTPCAAFYTLHGLIMMDPMMNRAKRLFYLSIERLLALRTSRIIAVSPEESRAAVKLGLGPSRVITVPNGVGTPMLRPRDEARAELGIAPDEVVAGFVGRLVEQKAPHVLIESFAAASKAAPNAKLIIVGDGPLRGAMQALSASLGVAQKVLFLGERDARQVLAAFDLFALSSRKEGLPYVLLEAMAAGMPLVATTTSCVELLIQQAVNGYVVAMDDTAGFTAALTDLLTHPDRIRQFGQASLQLAKQLTIDAMVDSTLEAYLRSVASRV